MTFLNPILASIALGCVAVPILIHILMRQRRRPVLWGAMKFLLEAYRQQRRRLRLEQLLLLAARCLLVALLALAVGKPILSAKAASAQRGPRTLFLLIDNSLTSTAALPRATPALEAHKALALKLIAELDQARGDRVAVIALASPTEALVAPATLDFSAAAAAVKELLPGDGRMDLLAGLRRLGELRNLDADGTTYVAILSELRVGSAGVEESLAPGAGAVKGARILCSKPGEVALANVAIAELAALDGVVVSSPQRGGEAPVRVTLRRSGDEIGRVGVTRVRLDAIVPGGEGAAGKIIERSVQWQAGEESATLTGNVEIPSLSPTRRAGAALLRARLDPDAIAGDDRCLRPVELRDRISVALLAPAGAGGGIDEFTPDAWLALALAPSDEGTLRTRGAGDISVTRIDPARELGDGAGPGPGSLGLYDAILIPEPHRLDAPGWKRVRAACDAGAAVVVFPPPGPAPGWGDAFCGAMGLDASIGAEPRDLGDDARIDPASGAGGRLLGMIAGELEELTRSVSVRRVIDARVRAGGMAPALTMRGGTPLVLVGAPERGGAPGASRGAVVLVTTAMDLAWTDIPARPLMVPLMQEIVRQGVGLARRGGTGVAGQSVSFPPGALELVRVPMPGDEPRPDSGGIGVVEGQRAMALAHAGVWQARDASGVGLGLVVANADVEASRVDMRSEPEIERWFGSLGGGVQWLDAQGAPASSAVERAPVLASGPVTPPISFPLLVLALGVGVAELVMGKMFSHGRVGERVAATGSVSA